MRSDIGGGVQNADVRLRYFKCGLPKTCSTSDATAHALVGIVHTTPPRPFAHAFFIFRSVDVDLRLLCPGVLADPSSGEAAEGRLAGAARTWRGC